jgi:Ase1/PRC1/MAP65 family protein
MEKPSETALALPPQNSTSFTLSLTSPSPAKLQKGKVFDDSENNTNHSQLSAFTPVQQPVMTPRGAPRGSMVLLSPSRTITETLNSLASTTAQKLEAIWDEVGYSPQERASQLSDLLVMFRDVCESKISEEQSVAETFRQTIADTKEEIRTLSSALKTLVDPQLLRKNSDLTLTDELSNLESSVEALREDAAAARDDLKESQSYLIEAHQALGIKLDEKWRDIESDLTISRRESFHLKVEEMKEEVSSRTAAVIQLVRDCQHLMNDLGINGQESESLFDRQISGSLVRSKDSSFIMASKFATETCTGISASSLEQLSTRASELSGEKRRRKTKLQEMGADIALLWEQLRIPESEQRAFTESVKGLGMDTIDKGEAELRRLRSLKAQKLGELINEARAEIFLMWEETNATEDYRRSFKEYFIENEVEFDDVLFDKHDEYIRVLHTRSEEMQPILKIIERREKILRERMEYEELQKDSDRLKQRGAAMAKQLMEEEKMAKRIKRDLPKLTKMLQEKLKQWKDQHGEDFHYNSEVYTDAMKRQEDEWAMYKESEMKLKLKKKQEEQNYEENRFLPSKPSKKKLPTRPLGDSTFQNIAGSSSRGRTLSKPLSRNATDATQQVNYES